jgi:hypothetical protein
MPIDSENPGRSAFNVRIGVHECYFAGLSRQFNRKIELLGCVPRLLVGAKHQLRTARSFAQHHYLVGSRGRKLFLGSIRPHDDDSVQVLVLAQAEVASRIIAAQVAVRRIEPSNRPPRTRLYGYLGPVCVTASK